MSVAVDEADLVAVGAVAIGVDPELLLDRSDVAALARIAAHAEMARNPVDAAASVLVGVVSRRPFPHCNHAAAWLITAHVLGVNGLDLRISDQDALALVTRVGRGEIGELGVATALACHVMDRHGGLRRVLRRLFLTPRSHLSWDPRLPLCPLCLRPLRVPVDGCRRPALSCLDAAGLSLPPGQRCPVVIGPDVGAGSFFLAYVTAGIVIFVPVDDAHGSAYDLVRVDDLHVSQLVGDWQRLAGSGRSLGRIGAAAIRFGPDGLLDWGHLVDCASAKTLAATADASIGDRHRTPYAGAR